ncbi:MAG: DUF2108 domain-containing protein [Methanocellales archaeon]|nr:DUF2108 domain-containing protein [Methanocellales archaeon]
MIEYSLALIAIIGSIAAVLYVDPIEKLIMLMIAAGAVVGTIAMKMYVDVAIAVAIMSALSTIIILIGLIRIQELRT